VLRAVAGLELSGRYRLEEPIGRGGMGEVWRGTDQRLRREVAIKILNRTLDAEGITEFRRDAETVNALQHPGITTLYDIDDHPTAEGRVVFLVLELLEGEDLHAYLADRPGGLPVPEALELAAQVADALTAAHTAGVLHLDVKPTNVFRLTDGQIKICDFGIAHLTDEPTRLTTENTPHYMAPELFRGEAVDHRTDLYSLGCVGYELLTGKPPFESDTGSAGLLYQHVNEDPEPLAISANVDRLVHSMLAKRPEDRPQNATEVALRLRGGTVEPSTVDPIPAAPPRPRSRALIPIAGAVALVVAGGGVAFALTDRGDETPPPPIARVMVTTTPAPSPSSDLPSVLAGWKTQVAPAYGIAYDVPKNWKVWASNIYQGFDRANGTTIGEKSVAGVRRGETCLAALAGVHGGKKPVPNPNRTALDELKDFAQEDARKIAEGAYSDVGFAAPPTVTVSRGRIITLHGLKAAHVVAQVTVNAQGEECRPASSAVVHTVALAGSDPALGPIIFNLFTDRGVAGQISDGTLKKIVASIRPYGCPAGTTAEDNKCGQT
jgi:hypothetical protein